MKRYALMLLAAATMALSACEKEKSEFYLENGRWEMTYIPLGYDKTSLTFDGDQVAVMHSNPFTKPLKDGVWHYAITDHSSTLRLWRNEMSTYIDDDGSPSTQSQRETLEFDLTLNDDQMTLIYDPWIGQTRTLKFSRTR